MRAGPPADSGTTIYAGLTFGSLWVDATYAYWLNGADNTLYRSARDGSSFAVLASPVSATQLAIDGTSVYWADSTAGTVYRVPEDAAGITSPTLIATGLTTPGGIAVDATSVYWSSGPNIVALTK